MANRLLTPKEFEQYVRDIAKKHGLDKYCSGIYIAGILVKWKKRGKTLPKA